MPRVAVMVEVGHGRLQGRLESVWVILKQPQDDAPDQSGKQREGVVLRLRYDSLLHRQTGKGKQNPGQKVHVNLAIDVIVVSKN